MSKLVFALCISICVFAVQAPAGAERFGPPPFYKCQDEEGRWRSNTWCIYNQSNFGYEYLREKRVRDCLLESYRAYLPETDMFLGYDGRLHKCDGKRKSGY